MPNVFDSSSAAIGSVQASLLTEVQFQAIFGTGWVLARGQNVSGSKYASITGASIVPDMRGMFLRGKNNGRNDGNEDPGGDRNVLVNTPQADQMQGHRHNYERATLQQTTSVGGGPNGYTIGTWPSTASSDPISDGANSTPRTGNETRPKNMAVNYFIRIN
ncbi:MAG: hypothetical protein EBU90_06400 [Proteobacteria bacterium]|nr:hypothetical protein [Pseudomonadota bacterium]NBP13548.1 hypothetical protein [bacterium]